MYLTEAQLKVGWKAAAEFYSFNYEDLPPLEQYKLQALMSEWLAPCFLVIPDTASSLALESGCYTEEFIEVARSFLLKKYRVNPLFVTYSDEMILQRLAPDELDEIVNTLIFLAGHALYAMELFKSAGEKKPHGFAASIDSILDNLHFIDIDQALEEMNFEGPE